MTMTPTTKRLLVLIARRKSRSMTQSCIASPVLSEPVVRKSKEKTHLNISFAIFIHCNCFFSRREPRREPRRETSEDEWAKKVLMSEYLFDRPNHTLRNYALFLLSSCALLSEYLFNRPNHTLRNYALFFIIIVLFYVWISLWSFQPYFKKLRTFFYLHV